MPRKKARFICFSEFGKYVDDFRGYFLVGIIGDCYRKEEPYRLCAAANPRFVKLSDDLQKMKFKTLIEFHMKLHMAYKMMLPYTKKESDILCKNQIHV